MISAADYNYYYTGIQAESHHIYFAHLTFSFNKADNLGDMV